MATDEDLVARVAAGDQTALGQLLRRWDGPLHAFVTRHTGGQMGNGDVEDLRQETWLQVVRAADRFQRDRKFSTWLFAIALNLCRDWHRARPAPPLPPAAVERVLDGNTGGADGTGNQPAAGAGLDAQHLLAGLPEHLRSAVVLRYYHDLSEEEMAQV